jgi:bisphosphoglycerate-dependent phosphoglycerate mutase
MESSEVVILVGLIDVTISTRGSKSCLMMGRKLKKAGFEIQIKDEKELETLE